MTDEYEDLKEFVPDVDMVLLSAALFSLGMYFGINVSLTLASNNLLSGTPKWISEASDWKMGLLAVGVLAIASLIILGYRRGEFSKKHD